MSLTTDRVVTRNGLVVSAEGRPVCPSCTRITGRETVDYDPAGPDKLTCEPVFLVKRKNAKTNVEFWGCKNFPACRHNQSTAAERATYRKIRTTAWANALFGPNPTY